MPNGEDAPNFPIIKELARPTLEYADASVRNYLPPVYQNLPRADLPLSRGTAAGSITHRTRPEPPLLRLPA